MIQVSAEKNSPIPIASRNCASIPFCFAIWRKNRRIQSWHSGFFQAGMNDDIICHMTSTYVTPPILEGIGSFQTLKPATPQTWVYCITYTFYIFMWVDVTWISTALAFQNEPNLSALCLDISRGVPASCVDFSRSELQPDVPSTRKNMWREVSEKLLMLALSSTTVWKTSRPCRRGKGIKHLSLIDASMPASYWITLPHLKSRHSL